MAIHPLDRIQVRCEKETTGSTGNQLDPEKSTSAAIAYFKELHQMFGDWATVLAAYNCGEGAVARVIREQKIDYLDNFWDSCKRHKTSRYFPRFLAVLAIINDPAKYGFTLDEPDKPLSCETVTIGRPVHLSTIADKLGIEVEDITALQPQNLRRDATPNTLYALRVPPGKGGGAGEPRPDAKMVAAEGGIRRPSCTARRDFVPHCASLSDEHTEESLR